MEEQAEPEVEPTPHQRDAEEPEETQPGQLVAPLSEELPIQQEQPAFPQDQLEQQEEFVTQQEEPLAQHEEIIIQQEELVIQQEEPAFLQDESSIQQEGISESIEPAQNVCPEEEMQVDVQLVYEPDPESEFSEDCIDSDLLILKPKPQQNETVDEDNNAELLPEIEMTMESVTEENTVPDEAPIQEFLEHPSTDGNECSVITVTEQFIHDAQLQLTTAMLELEKSQESLRNQEINSECYRQQRDSAIEERNSLMDMISRLNSELKYLKDINLKKSSQLQYAISQNCEIMSKGEELKTKELALKYREGLMDQERNILNDRILTLTSDLNKTNFELETCQIKQSSKISTLEIQLNGKIEELGIADDNISYLREERIKLIQEVDNLTQKLQEQHEIDSKNCDELRKKLSAKSKIADLYKNMRDDSNDKCEELMNGVAELQKLLNEAVNKYGELENKNIQIEIENEFNIKQKDDMINGLNIKIENAESQLKKFQAESASLGLSQLSPTAAIAREFLKSGMSLAEIYSQWVQFSDELIKKNDENKYLTEALTTAVNTLEKNAPLLSNQSLQYDKMMDDNSIITQQLEAIELEYSQLKDDYSESLRVCNHYERENNRLRDELQDLGNQVCFLLKEIEISRGGSVNNRNDSMNTSLSSENNASSIISKNLVTFSDIQEIQANNKKLLKIIRELTTKQEEDDVLKEQIESGELQSKLELLGDRVAELQGAKDRQTKTINGLIAQRDMYKKLYHNKAGSIPVNEDVEMKENDATLSDSKCDKSVSFSDEHKILSQQLEETKNLLNQQTEDYKKYESLAESKEKLLLSQADKLRKELSDLNDTYRKCYCSLETNVEKNKILQNDSTAQRKKVAALEEKNEKCNSKISEHEMSIKFLREKMTNTSSKLAKAEVMITNLQKECQFLKNNNNLLLNEKERLNEDEQERRMLLHKLETVKDIIEKKKIDDSNRLGAQVDEFSRECSLLHRKLQETHDKFSELFSVQNHQSKSETDRLRLEELQLNLSAAQEDLENKNKLVKELNEKIALYDNENIRELKNQLNERNYEIMSLQKQLNDSQNHMQQFSHISEGAEGELKTLSTKFNEYKTSAEIKLNNTQKMLIEYKEKCDELEAELSLQNNNEQKVNEVNEEIKLMSLQLSEKMHNLDEANEEINRLTANLLYAEQNYSQTDALYINKSNELSMVKSEIHNLDQTIEELKIAKTNLEASLNESQLNWEGDKQKWISEKNDIEILISDLREQNSLLHDQLEVLNSQLSLSQSTRQLENLNESIADRSMNMSSSEDDMKSISQLTRVIKFLRKERDVYITKFNSICDENLQIKSQLESAEIKLKENLHDKKAESSSSNTMKHSEIMQKVQSINTISNNNILLREERDSLLTRVKEMTDTIKRLEESLNTLQNINNEIVKENNALATKNTCVQVECSRWKGRVNSLTEKATKTNAEDWKRLQNERETLAKMLTLEKDNVKKLREEAVHSKIEKTKLEEKYNAINKQHGLLTEEIKKQTLDLNTLRREITQLTAELTDAKSLLLSSTEENKKMQENMATQNNLVLESRNKESQIRKIAKQYKSQYEELSKTVEEEKKKAESQTPGVIPENTTDVSDEYEKKIIEIEKANIEQSAELKAQITSSAEENNTLQREIEVLRNKILDVDDKARQGLKNAKAKIMVLTESKENLAKELTEANTKLEQFEQNKDEIDDRLAALKSQYEGRIVKLEKEKMQLQQEQSNTAALSNKQIETLTQKIAQMQKQIDQHTKPSASGAQGDKPINEPPTANIKPMSGSQQSIGIRRTIGDTPLASIRPMTSVAGIRTAAVLPNAQYSTASNIHHLPHATGDSTITLPGISQVTEFTASNPSMRHSPCSNQIPMESSQDTDSDMTEKLETNVTVALVTPRIDSSSLDTMASHASNQQHLTTVTGSSSSSSISPVTTSISPAVGRVDDSNTSNNQKRSRGEESTDRQNSKRVRVQATNEAEYQVPTSSQKDQDDSVIVVDSDEEDENQYADPSLYEYNMQGTQEVDEEDEDEEDDDEDEDDDDDDEDDDDDDDNEEEDGDEEMAEDDDVVEGEIIAEEEVPDEEEETQRNEENDDDEDGECHEVIEEEVEDEEDGSESVASTEDPTSDMIPHDDNRIIDTQEIASTSNVNVQTSCANSGRTHAEEMLIPTGRSENFRGSAINAGSVAYDEPDDGIVPSTPILFLPSKNEGYGDNVQSASLREDADDQFSFANDAVVEEMDNTHADLTPQLESRLPTNSALTIANNDASKVSENSNSALSVQDGISGISKVDENTPEDDEKKLE